MQRPARRDFALLILIDTSGSTDAWVCGAQRVIDIEKEALLIVCAALDALRVRFAIQAFSGYGKGNVRVRELKDCGQPFGDAGCSGNGANDVRAEPRSALNVNFLCVMPSVSTVRQANPPSRA